MKVSVFPVQRRILALAAAALLLIGSVGYAGGLPQVIGTVTVTNPYYVNVRTGGDTSYPVIAQVLPGSVYPCVGIAPTGWYAILLDDGRTGYVANTLTAYTSSQPQPSQPQPPAYNQAQVTIYYRDVYGSLIYTDYAYLGAGSSAIQPNSALVPGYRLLGPSSVTVNVSGALQPTPASVTFLYARNATPTAAPQQPAQPVSTYVPVSYIMRDGSAFYTASVQLWSGVNYVAPDYNKVPAGYRLVGNATIQVNVSAQGRATPSAVVFIFEPGAAPAPVTPPPAPVTPAPAPVTPAPSADQPNYLPAFVKTRPNKGNYPVYTGPGEGYYRVGNATLGGGVIRVYGQENGWALIGYGLSNGGYRIGFVSMSAIPSGIYPQELSLTRIARTNVRASLFVDDPIVSKNRELVKRYEGGSPFIFLGYLNDFWAYVEIENFEGTGLPARGFVSRRSLGV